MDNEEASKMTYIYFSSSCTVRKYYLWGIGRAEIA